MTCEPLAQLSGKAWYADCNTISNTARDKAMTLFMFLGPREVPEEEKGFRAVDGALSYRRVTGDQDFPMRDFMYLM